MNISKDQVMQLLESQGNHDKAQQASQQLPDQVDTDNGQHADLLSKRDGSLGTSSAGSGKFSNPLGGDGVGGLAGVGVGGRQRAPSMLFERTVRQRRIPWIQLTYPAVRPTGYRQRTDDS